MLKRYKAHFSWKYENAKGASHPLDLFQLGLTLGVKSDAAVMLIYLRSPTGGGSIAWNWTELIRNAWTGGKDPDW